MMDKFRISIDQVRVWGWGSERYARQVTFPKRIRLRKLVVKALKDGKMVILEGCPPDGPGGSTERQLMLHRSGKIFTRKISEVVLPLSEITDKKGGKQ